MRIMMVTASLRGPIDTANSVDLHIRSLSRALRERGHRIAALTRRAAASPTHPTEIEAIFSTRVVFSSLLTKLFQVDPVVYLDTLRVLRTWAPDILHLHNFLDLSFAPIAAAHRLRIPVLATVHSYWPICLRHRRAFNEDRSCRQYYAREVCAPCLVRGLRSDRGVRVPVPAVSLVLRGAWRARQWILQKVARFIVPSGVLAGHLRESGYLADRMAIIPHGLPQENFVVSARQPNPVAHGPNLLCVGSLLSGKGVQYLLEALHLVREVRPDVTLTVAGEGVSRPALERLCASLGLNEAVRFIGHQPRSLLPELYATADLAVLPSLSEAFSFAALEAAATGIPVVATTVGGVPEIFGDGAILVPPMDAPALAKGILAVLSDPTTAAARARVAQERYLTHFGFETMVNRTEAVYAEVVGHSIERNPPPESGRAVRLRIRSS